MAVNASIAPFINQTFYVTGEYGTVRPTHTHVGVDLATSGTEGANLYSMVNGTVIYKDYSSVRGNYIIMKSDETEIAFNYQHMENESPLNVGDKVIIGQFVGIEGSTGEVTGKHLHLEEQDLSSGRDWNFSTNIDYFKNPCEFMNIPNVTGTECYYNGTPIPPKPIIIKKQKFPWAVFSNIIRKQRRF